MVDGYPGHPPPINTVIADWTRTTLSAQVSAYQNLTFRRNNRPWRSSWIFYIGILTFCRRYGTTVRFDGLRYYSIIVTSCVAEGDAERMDDDWMISSQPAASGATHKTFDKLSKLYNPYLSDFRLFFFFIVPTPNFFITSGVGFQVFQGLPSLSARRRSARASISAVNHRISVCVVPIQRPLIIARGTPPAAAFRTSKWSGPIPRNSQNAFFVISGRSIITQCAGHFGMLAACGATPLSSRASNRR